MTTNFQIGLRPEIIRKKEDQETFTSNKVNPRITVISPSLNHESFIEDTILSIARQSFKDFEHIIMDGGSTDSTHEIVKKYPHVDFYSEKDSGPCEAFNKGLKIAKGDYVIMSCTSDGLLSEDWLKTCVEIMDNDPEISLVWGLPQYLSEDGFLGPVSYIDSHFKNFEPPQKFEYFEYWKQTKFWLPEGNFCVRKKIYDECFPKDDFNKTIEPCLEFNYNFNSRGYLAYFVNVVANFGRTHNNQMGQIFARSGMGNLHLKDYFGKTENYLNNLHNTPHQFRDGKSITINKI
jgi:glycosyltransferase involved in cell wall biosynthesis